MFRHEGVERTDRENRQLAAFLASNAGFVNSASFVLIGVFTSHTTGNVGRLADQLARGDFALAGSAAVLVTAFFFGAFVASMAIESNVFRRLPYTYAALMVAEATLLALFLGATHMIRNGVGRDLSGALLCFAMGLQNSLVTRVSGAIVRTTHLTGVITDLGIESARWFRFWRANVGARLNLRLAIGIGPPEKPAAAKIALLLTIAGSFISGSIAGALAVAMMQRTAMLIPCGFALWGALYAYTRERFTPADRG